MHAAHLLPEHGLRVPAAALAEIEDRCILRVTLLNAVGRVERVKRSHVVVVQVVVAGPGRVVCRDPAENPGREAQIATAGAHVIEAAVVGLLELGVADFHKGLGPEVGPPGGVGLAEASHMGRMGLMGHMGQSSDHVLGVRLALEHAVHRQHQRDGLAGLQREARADRLHARAAGGVGNLAVDVGRELRPVPRAGHVNPLVLRQNRALHVLAAGRGEAQLAGREPDADALVPFPAAQDVVGLLMRVVDPDPTGHRHGLDGQWQVAAVQKARLVARELPGFADLARHYPHRCLVRRRLVHAPDMRGPVRSLACHQITHLLLRECAPVHTQVVYAALESPATALDLLAPDIDAVRLHLGGH